MIASSVRAALIAAVIALPCSSALAQEKPSPAPGVSIGFRSVTTGAPEVIAKPRRFAPVTVVLSNDGPKEVEGLLRVYRRQEVASGAGPSSVPEQALFYERPLKLPRGARRTETIYYYCQDREPDRLCVAFEQVGADPVVVFPKLSLRTDDVFVLSVTSNDIDEAAKLGGGALPGPRRPYPITVKRADLAALPERAEGYAPFDLIVISDLDLRALSTGQVQALRTWVLGGGDLMVAFSGKAAEGMGGFDDDLLPVTAAPGAATEERDVRPVQALAPGLMAPIERANMLAKRVIERPDARVLLGEPRTPLVVRGRAGAGRVTYVSFPLSAVSSWPGSRALLALALRPPGDELELSGVPASPPLDEALLNLTEALRTLEPPSALLVGPLLILYVALVAPVNYLVLSRLGKRSYSYATAGAIALVFGTIFYLVGWFYKGSNALVARAAVIELSGSPALPSRIDSLTGFFSTDRGVVDAKPAGGAAIAPIAERSSGRSARVIEPSSGEPQLRAVELDTWALRRFRSLKVAPRGAIVADLRFDGAHVVGKITNATTPRATLEAPTLFIGNRCVELEDIAPGATLAVDAIPGERPAMRIADRLLAKLSRYSSRFDDVTSGDPFDNDPRRRIRAMLERRAAAMNPSPDALPALLAGVLSLDPEGIDLDTSAQIDLARALAISEAEVLTGTSTTNDFIAGGLTPRILGFDGYEPRPGSEGAAPRLNMGQKANEGYVAYEWRLPSSPERPLNIRSLELRWRFGEAPEPDTFAIDVFDWSAGKYASIVAGTVLRDGVNALGTRASQIARFVEPGTGAVRVLLRTKSARDVAVEQLTLNVSGRYDTK